MDRIPRIKDLIESVAMIKADEGIILASGRPSPYYVDTKMVALHPEGATLIATEFFDYLRKTVVEFVGGLAQAAIPLVAALSVVSHIYGHPLYSFYVRRDVKEYGSRKLIEGHIYPGKNVAVVDDVITTGGSMLRTIEVVEAAGAHVTHALAVVDRNRDGDGSQRLRDKGIVVFSLFTMDDEGNLVRGNV